MDEGREIKRRFVGYVFTRGLHAVVEAAEVGKYIMQIDAQLLPARMI